MALIEISETQLAFGYLHSYLNVIKPRRFMLPSLRQEGGSLRFLYPGADIIIDNNHLIQFKRPYFFSTNGIKEFWNYTKPTDINPPYFRFYIKNDNPTNQLNSLINATKAGLTAEYISPTFHREDTFFRLLNNDIDHLNSYAHIDISQFDGMQATIGANNNHTIIYTDDSISSGFCYCFSEPKKIEASNFKNDSNRRYETRNFKGVDIVKLLVSIFFSEDSIPFQNSPPLLQCLLLQQKLLIERNIIWTFTYRVN